MKLSREKVLHMSHQILAYLDRDDGEVVVDVVDNEGCVRGQHTAIGVETPSLNPSGSLNWNSRAPQYQSSGSFRSVHPVALMRAAAASKSAGVATLVCR